MGKPKPNKPRKPDPSIALAMATVPAIQVANDRFEICDVSNHSDGDQRHMVRSGQRKTVKRMTRLEKLHSRGMIDKRHLRACEWYAEAHEHGYETIGCTANYSGMSGHGFGPKDHFSRQRFQFEARADYIWARNGIPSMLLPVFERVVLNGANLDEASEDIYAGWSKAKRVGCASIAFKEAADALVARIERVVSEAA